MLDTKKIEHYQEDRTEMYNETFRQCPNAEEYFKEGGKNTVFYLLGRRIPSCNEDEMLWIWCIAGQAIFRMYTKARASRTGVG